MRMAWPEGLMHSMEDPMGAKGNISSGLAVTRSKRRDDDSAEQNLIHLNLQFSPASDWNISVHLGRFSPIISGIRLLASVCMVRKSKPITVTVLNNRTVFHRIGSPFCHGIQMQFCNFAVSYGTSIVWMAWPVGLMHSMEDPMGAKGYIRHAVAVTRCKRRDNDSIEQNLLHLNLHGAKSPTGNRYTHFVDKKRGLRLRSQQSPKLH